MELLQQVFESDEFQSYLTENDEILEAAQDVVLEFPKSLKYYMLEHLDLFIVPNDLDATYNNMVEFVEAGTERFIKEICAKLRGENLDE